jgi:HSP20 family protein
MPAPRGPRAPAIDIAELHDHVEDALDHWFAGTRGWLPAVDLIRGPSEVLLRADVPGVKPDDLRIEVDGDTVTISGERPEADAPEEWSHLREERRCGLFSRSLAVPGRIDAAKVDARLQDGILEVTLPLRPCEADAKTVRIRPTR